MPLRIKGRERLNLDRSPGETRLLRIESFARFAELASNLRGGRVIRFGRLQIERSGNSGSGRVLNVSAATVEKDGETNIVAIVTAPKTVLNFDGTTDPCSKGDIVEVDVILSSEKTHRKFTLRAKFGRRVSEDSTTTISLRREGIIGFMMLPAHPAGEITAVPYEGEDPGSANIQLAMVARLMTDQTIVPI